MITPEKLFVGDPIRQKIRDYYRIDENQIVDELLPLAEVGARARSRAWERARELVVNIRSQQKGEGGIDALLNEFSLSSEEGVVLMCLAEALLRVPDEETQDELIRDKLTQGDWSSHLGNSESLFVNASSWGLLITGKVVNYTDKDHAEQLGLLKRTIGRLGEPVIRKAVQFAMRIMGRQFVMGRDIDEALERATASEQKGYTYSYDMLGEGARTMADADRYFNSYMMAIHAIGKMAAGRGPIKSPGISVKLSAIHPRYEFTHRERVMNEMVPRLRELALAAKKYDINFTVDAEEADRLDLSLDVIEAVFTDPALEDWSGFGMAVQAYLKRAPYVIDWVKALTDRVGRKMMVRLVKGAYWDTEIKRAQKDGMSDYPVFTRKAATDVCYAACASKLLAYRDSIFPQFATHNAYTAATILEMAGADRSGFEFQRLHGMGEALYDQIVQQEGVQCRVYAPVGQHEDLLAYLVRRLLENGANSSFVNAIVDESKSVESLLPDPVERMQALGDKSNPHIVKPLALYGEERVNSKGLDLTDINEVIPLKQQLEDWWVKTRLSEKDIEPGALAVRNPANHEEIVGQIRHLDESQMKQALDRAEAAFAQWSQRPVSQRADLLRRVGDILERHRYELIGLCIKEAGKVAQDAIDEVREAVDFCRYYAARAEELAEDPRLQPRGVVVCISPWNFPLAIFLGQVAAAMVSGNTVLAKPSEQTCLIALRTIELMQSVGVPEDVVQPIIGRGSQVGKVILPDRRVKAVMFTGSTATGTLISQILAERGGDQVPLIAETGGQNCMIVDSTALPEQVVDDVIHSGFQSAGQRCSALRVLYVQNEIADKVITMLKGAMKELSVGDPMWLSTDVGPVIDQPALDSLNAHVEYMQNKGKLLYTSPVPEVDYGHTFFAPRLYEIDSISVLKDEVFGPCVHVIRFDGEKIDQVIRDVNSTGFGLTMGVHSRIESRADYLAKLSAAGNIYINRNMIGAVVGVQPFGGRGLSGTGPKAGGPNYLHRLVAEKPAQENVQASHAKVDDMEFVITGEMTDRVDAQMQNAQRVAKQWQDTPLEQRISVCRRFLASLADVQSIQDLAEDLEKTIADARAQLLLVDKKIGKPLTMPGPTGESNVLYYEPRGTLLCYADRDTSFHFWTMALISCLASGNTVITVVSEHFHEQALAFLRKWKQAEVPEGVLQVAPLSDLKALLHHQQLTGVVIGRNCQRMGYLNQQLAARQGAILPLISSEYYDRLLMRLVTEKTVSIDTTASGGNTSLMTLQEDE